MFFWKLPLLFTFALLTFTSNYSKATELNSNITENTNEKIINPIDKIVTALNSYRKKLDDRSRHLTLKESIDEALHSNSLLAAAYFSIKEEEYKIKSQNRQQLPRLTLQSGQPFLGKVYTSNSSTRQVLKNEYKYNPSTDSYTINAETDDVSSNSSQDYYQFSPYLTLSWSFFQPSLWAKISSSEEEIHREKLVFDITMRGLILQIQESYFRLQSSQDLISDFEKIYQINTAQIKYVNARMKAGLLNIGDVAQAEAQFYSQASELVGFYEKYFSDLYHLAYLLNLEPNNFVVSVDPLKKSQGWDQSLSGTISQSLELREEIQAYMASSKASTWNSKASIRKYLPVLSIQGNSYGYREWDGRSYSESRSGLNFSSTYIDSSIGLGVNWTLFDSGVAAAESETFKQNAKQQQFKANNEKFKVIQQVQTAYSSYLVSNDEIFLNSNNAIASQKFLEATQQRFKVGLSSMTSIVQAMQALGNSLKAQSISILKHNISIAELYRYSSEWPKETPDSEEVKLSLEKLDPLKEIKFDVVE